jgi:putative ABC transport system permease protein
VLAFAFLATLSTAVLFGLVPTLSSLRAVSHRTSDSTGRIGNRLRSLLIVWEVALALILLVGAGLLGRSVWELGRVDPGFHAERVVTLRTKLPETRYPSDDHIRAFGTELVTRLGSLPGVSAVGFTNELPMSSTGLGGSFAIEGRPATRPEERPGSWLATVGGGYFDAMGIPLLRGRWFGDGDTESTTPVYIIDEALARRHWPDEDPIGARVAVRWRRGAAPIVGEIVGVVGSVRFGLAREPNPLLYSWFPQEPNPRIMVVARTTGDPLAMANPFTAEVAAIDPDQPIAEIQLMEGLVSSHVSQPRTTLVVLGSFAAAALLLLSIGLYGVLAFGVAQRTKEIGIRVVIGAERGDVVRLFMRRGLRLTSAGLAIGIVVSLALGRVVAGLLFGVTPTDTATLLACALFLLAVATVASYLPARHASRLDPIDALKHD